MWQQLEDDLLAFWRAQVQCDRLFVASLQGPEKGGVASEQAPLAEFIACPRSLNLKNLGAELGKKSARIRSRDQIAEF